MMRSYQEKLRLVAALLLCAMCGLPGHAQAVTAQDSTLPAEKQLRYRNLINELRCLVCQNQTIADSNAELATDLRKQVHQRIAAGETDDEIRTYVTERYGDFVLYKPPLTARTLLLWVGPFALLVIVIAAVLLRFRRKKSMLPPDKSVDSERLAQLLKDDEAS